MRQQLAQQSGMRLREAAGQGLDQPRALVPQDTFGQVGQYRAVALARPEAPRISVATSPSLMFADSSSL
jgi:hypothetical protein